MEEVTKTLLDTIMPPGDVHLNLTGYGDIYINRNNAVYKFNIDKFLKEFCCLVQVVFNDEGGNK